MLRYHTDTRAGTKYKPPASTIGLSPWLCVREPFNGAPKPGSYSGATNQKDSRGNPRGCDLVDAATKRAVNPRAVEATGDCHVNRCTRKTTITVTIACGRFAGEGVVPRAVLPYAKRLPI